MSPSHASRSNLRALALVFACLVCGCGQMGPLTLPEPVLVPAPAPAPAPAGAEQDDEDDEDDSSRAGDDEC